MRFFQQKKKTHHFSKIKNLNKAKRKKKPPFFKNQVFKQYLKNLNIFRVKCLVEKNVKNCVTF
jgi:hypothetical protein